jgi:Bacterial type II and III secretion system protein
MSVGLRHSSPLPLAFLTAGLLALSSTPAFAQQPPLVQATRRAQPAQDVQIQIDAHIISLSVDEFERIGVDFESRSTAEAGRVVARPTPDTLFLTEKQKNELMESMSGNGRMNVLSEPKLITLNGQTAVVSIGQGDEIKLRVTPVVSSDRRSIRVCVKADVTEHCSPGSCVKESSVNTQVVENTVAIPDGGTTLLFGPKKTVDVRYEYGPPMLSRIPYLERLFKNVGYSQETRQLMVVLTPRIVVPESEELKARVKEPPEYPGLQLGDRHAEKLAIFEMTEESAVKVEPRQNRMGKAVADLVKAYREACAVGQIEEAEKLARAALLLDPTCFAK